MLLLSHSPSSLKGPGGQERWVLLELGSPGSRKIRSYWRESSGGLRG